MIRIQFNGSLSMKQADFRMIDSNTVELKGEKIKPETTGFKAYRLNGEFLGDYSDYTKIVGETENGFLFGK